MGDIGESIFDELVRPDTVPCSIEFRPMRFFEVYRKVSIERFGERRRLVRAACQNALRDHRVKDVSNLDAHSVEKVEIEFGVVKDLDYRWVRQNIRKLAELHSLAERNQNIAFAVRELDRKDLAVFRIQRR